MLSLSPHCGPPHQEIAARSMVPDIGTAVASAAEISKLSPIEVVIADLRSLRLSELPRRQRAAYAAEDTLLDLMRKARMLTVDQL